MKKGKTIIKFTVVLTVIAVVISLIGATLIFDEFNYIIKDTASHIGKSIKLEKRYNLNFKSYTLNEVKENPKITFNNNLLLINEEHLIPSETEMQLADYSSLGILMDENLCEPYKKLTEDIFQNFGENLYISSSYRTSEKQAKIKDEEGDTAQSVGASEHQAGLALDVYIQYFAGMGFIKSNTGQYVNSYCYKYGFIIRYPYFDKKTTGIEYEPWHIRYVGEPHAEIISKNRITLEEYISDFKPGEFYEYDGYIISRQIADDEIKLPEKYNSAEISSDNCGNYIITIKI